MSNSITQLSAAQIKYKSECIQAYRNAGFDLFHCKNDRKPAYTGWQTPDLNLNPNTLGRAYGLLPVNRIKAETYLIMDYDPRRDEGRDQLTELCNKIGITHLLEMDTFIVKTGRGGYHIYLQLPLSAVGVKFPRDLTKLGFPAIEPKSKGRYVVGAGSIHDVSGEQYTVSKGSPDQIAEAPQELIDFMAKPEFESICTESIENDSEDNQQFYAYYLKHCAPPAISGKYGNNTTYDVALYGRDLGLSETVTSALIAEHYNERCQPSWLDSELRGIVAHAYTYGQGIQGNAHPSNDFNHIALEIYSRKIHELQSSLNDGVFTPITATKLMGTEFEEPRWAIEGLLPEGLTIMAGPPKIGKSWLALSLGLAISTGGKSLGSFQATKGQVLYLALEDNNRRLKDRLTKIVGKNNDLVSENLFFKTDIPRFDEGGLEILGGWIDEHPDCRLVIIDTVARFSPSPKSKMDAYNNDSRVFGKIQKVAIARQIALVLITHNRKLESSDPLEKVMGSTAVTGCADTIWLLKRGRGQGTGILTITGRDVQELELALRFNKPVCQWEYLGNAEEIQLSEERRNIIDYLRLVKKPTRPKEVAEALGTTVKNTKSLMYKMFRAGQLNNVNGKYSVSDPADDFTNGQLP